MAKPRTITSEELRELIHYDPTTGLLTWKKSRPGIIVGREIGCLSKNGYVLVRILSKTYLAHRLVFLYMTGQWPEQDVDHINGVRTDNRWENLRSVTRAQNLANRVGNLNRDLPKNIYRHPSGKFRVKLKKDGVFFHVGYFSTLHEAQDAAERKQLDLFGEYAKKL